MMKTIKMMLACAALMLCGGAWAATPVAVWDGDFNVLTKNGYTININGNTNNGKDITIGATQGVIVSGGDIYTIVVKTSAYTPTQASNPEVTLSMLNGDSAYVGYGVLNDKKGYGIWAGSAWGVNYSGRNFGSVIVNSETENVFALSYSYSANSQVLQGTTGYGNGTKKNWSDLRSDRFAKSTGVLIGGPKSSSNTLKSMNGLKIFAIAIFGADATENDIKTYTWPVDATLPAIDYSMWKNNPAVMTWNGTSTTFHDGPWKYFNIADGSDGAAVTTSNIPGQSAAVGSIWNIFCAAGNAYDKYVAPGYVLRLTSDKSGNLSANYNNFALGGLIVEQGAKGYMFRSTGDRPTDLGNKTSVAEKKDIETWFEIRESVVFNREGVFKLYGPMNFNIAADKIFDLNSERQNAAHQPTLDVSTNAKLIMHGDGNLRVGTLVATGDVTLDFSDLAVNRVTPYIEGGLTLDESTRLMLPAGLEPEAEYVLCSGTLSAPTLQFPTTIKIGNVTKKVRLTYNATNKSVSYVMDEAAYWTPNTAKKDADGIIDWTADDAWIVDGDEGNPVAWPTDGTGADISVKLDAATIGGVKIDGQVAVKEVIVECSDKANHPFEFHNHTKGVEKDSETGKDPTTDKSVDCLTASVVNMGTYKGNLGLKVPIVGTINFGENTHLIFKTGATGGDASNAYDYTIVGNTTAIEVDGSGKFIVPSTMYGVPFAPNANATIVFDVADGEATSSAIISGSGSVAKTGAGSIKFTTANTFTGGLYVEAGEAKTTNATGFGPNNYENLNVNPMSKITVSSGATLDLAVLNGTSYDITCAGTLKNSGNDLGTGTRQTAKLTMSGNVTVNGNQFGLLANSWNATSLDMGGNTLTVSLNSGKDFILSNTTITNPGLIDVTLNTIDFVFNRHNLTIDASTVNFPNGARVMTLIQYPVQTTASMDHMEFSNNDSLGYVLVAEGNLVKIINPAAKIVDGEGVTTYYPTLQDAITAAGDDHLSDIIDIAADAVVPTGYRVKDGVVMTAATYYAHWSVNPGVLSWIIGSANLTANANQYKVFDISTGTDGDTIYNGNTAAAGLPGYSNNVTPWHLFVKKNGFAGIDPGYVLRFPGDGSVTVKDVAGNFAPFNLGGIIVEPGAKGYALADTSSDNGRGTDIGDPSNIQETWTVINEDFKIARSGVTTLHGPINIEVAKGKVFDINQSQDYALNVVGTLKLHGAGRIKVKTLNASGATLDYSDSMQTEDAPYVLGDLSVDDTTKFVLPSSVEENTEFILCSGTLTAPAFSVLTTMMIDGEETNVRLTYNATNKSVSYAIDSTVYWTPNLTKLLDGGIVDWTSDEKVWLDADGETARSWSEATNRTCVRIDAAQVAGVKINGKVSVPEVIVSGTIAPPNSFEFHNRTLDVEGDSTTDDETDCLTANVINLAEYTGNLGLKVPIKGQINFGTGTHLIFKTGTAGGEASNAYSYDIVGRAGAIEVAGEGKFQVPTSMYNIPFAPNDTATIVYDDADTAITGTLSGTGTIELRNGKTLTLNPASGQTLHYVSAGTTANTLSWAGNGNNVLSSNDSKEKPFVTVESGATLNIDGHDYAGWNGGIGDHSWFVNNGTLVFQNDGSSRFWRDHIVLGDGSSVKIDTGNRHILLYGGAGTADNCQIMLASGTATIEAGVTNTGKTRQSLYFGNDGAGDYGDNEDAKHGAGISVGSGAILTVSVPVSGGDTLTKWGAGSLVLQNVTDYTGTITLAGGSITVPAKLADGRIVPVEGLVLDFDESTLTYSLYETPQTWSDGAVIFDGDLHKLTANDDGTYTKVVDGVTYTIDLNGHELVTEGNKSYILIKGVADGNNTTLGVKVTRASDTSGTGATVIMRYSDYPIYDTTKYQVAMSIDGSTYENIASIHVADMNGNLKDGWANYYGGARGNANDSVALDAGGNTLALTYNAGGGIYAYQLNSAGEWVQVMKDTGAAGDSTYNIGGFALGGMYVANENAQVAAGLKIHSVAVTYTPITSATDSKLTGFALTGDDFVYSGFLTNTPAATGWYVDSLDDLLDYEFHGTMDGEWVSGSDVNARGFYVAKDDDSVTFQMQVRQTGDGDYYVKAVKVKMTLDANNQVFISTVGAGNKYQAQLGAKVESFTGTLATSATGAGYGVNKVVATKNPIPLTSVGFDGDTWTSSKVMNDFASGRTSDNFMNEKGTNAAVNFEEVRNNSACKAVKISNDVRPSYKNDANLTFSKAIKNGESWTVQVVAKMSAQAGKNLALWGIGETSYQGSGDRGVVLRLDTDGRPRFGKYGNKSFTEIAGASEGESLYDNRYHVYTVTCDKDAAVDKYIVYVDGVQVASSGSAELATIPTSNQYFEVGTVRGGAEQLPSSNKAIGSLFDDVAAWNIALSAAQVKANAVKFPVWPLAIPDITTQVTKTIANDMTDGWIQLGQGGVYKLTGNGGLTVETLKMKAGSKIEFDPVRTPILASSFSVEGNTTFKLVSGRTDHTSEYMTITCGLFRLVTYPNTLNINTSLITIEGLSSEVSKTVKIIDVPDTDYKQLVVDVGDYEANGKTLKITQFGDSITEGIWRSGVGTPNYRIPLMHRLETHGYKPRTTGFRGDTLKNGSAWGSSDANGVRADPNYRLHNGISAQRVYTGATGSFTRAGFIEGLEAYLEASGDEQDVITIKIGTNDTIGGETAERIFEGWKTLVNRLIKARPTARIVVTSILPLAPEDQMKCGGDYSEMIRKAVQGDEDEGVEPIFPANTVFYVDCRSACPKNDGNFLSDNVHPNWKGYNLMADAWLDGVMNAAKATTGKTYTPNTNSGAVANVPVEYRKGFVKLASMDLAQIKKDISAWGESPYMTLNEVMAAKGLTQVAYYVERSTTLSRHNQFVWVDMDAWAETKNLANVGVPTEMQVNQLVDNLHVYSNLDEIRKVEPTTSGVKGTLLFTNKKAIPAGGITGAPESKYGMDWNDSIDANTNYGVMNVSRIYEGVTATTHRYAMGQTLFSYNAFNDNRVNVLGIGDFAVHGKQSQGNSEVSPLTMNWVSPGDNYTKMNTDCLDNGIIEIWGKVEGAVVPEAGEPVVVEAQTAEDAIAQTVIVVEDAEADAAAGDGGQAQYLELVATETSSGSGQWIVKAEVKATAVVAGGTKTVQETVEEAAISFANEGLESIAGATVTTHVDIPAAKVVPGLYYSVSYGTTPDNHTEESDRVLATGSNVTIPVPALSNENVYYIKVKASATKQSAAEMSKM